MLDSRVPAREKEVGDDYRVPRFPTGQLPDQISPWLFSRREEALPMFPIRQSNRPLLLVLGMGGIIASVFLRPQQVRGAPAPDQPNGKTVAPIPFPDGVTDPERRTAFVSSPKGGIQAIRLEDGKVLWTNDEVKAQPWLVAGTRLVGRGERLLVLDLRKEGKLVRQCDAPAYPKVEVPDRCTVSFNLWGAHAAGDVLESKWYAVAAIDRSKGRPFSFQAWTAFNKAVPVGTVKVHLDTGRVEVQTDPKPADVTGELMPQAAKPAQRMPAGLPEKLTAVWQQHHKDQDGRIAVLDGRLVGVSLILEKAGQEYLKKVVLNSWDLKTAKAAEPVELVKDKALAIANVMLTEDRRHAAVQFSTSALTIYSLADGKTVASDVKGVSSPTNAIVDGTRLYSVEPTGTGGGRTLRALDLKSGKPVWDRPVQPRSTIPLPP
jgi:outer membrane protein assembly factor BamB